MSNNIDTNTVKLKAKDFASDQDVRWCPGCGDYSILAQVQRSFPEIYAEKKDVVWISGIGCSSRFPYYMDTFGFHSIHGRGAPIATGLKISRPELSVWVASGDGDLLSIGGNHFIHACRKNIDLKILMFNNRIYGLTKGQYSPTSEKGKITKSTPYGSVAHPFNPTSVAIGSDATFVARTIDREPKHMQEMIKRASQHKGIAFIEIYQNCNIFNDGAFRLLTEKETKFDNLLYLEHGKPMVFGKEKDKGIRLNNMHPEIVDLTTGDFSEKDLWVHDEHSPDPYYGFILSHMADNPSLPTPIGIFRDIDKPTYDGGVAEQVEAITDKKGKGNLESLLFSGNTWEVK